jgi:hypothetical protein
METEASQMVQALASLLELGATGVFVAMLFWRMRKADADRQSHVVQLERCHAEHVRDLRNMAGLHYNGHTWRAADTRPFPPAELDAPD